MKISVNRSLRSTGRKGFNLIEAAIVLGIVGLVVGGIWVAASAVYENMRVSRGAQQLLQIVQQMRSIYSTQTTLGANGDITEDLVKANVFPTDMRDNDSDLEPKNPWRGRTYVRVIDSGARFWVILDGLPQSACVDLAVRNSGQGRDNAMESVSMSGSAQGTGDPSGAEVPPVTVTTAAAACDTDDANDNSVAFLFRLRS